MMELTPFKIHLNKFILLRCFLFCPSIMSATTKRQLSEKDNERIAEIHMELTQWRHKAHMKSPEKDRVPFRVPALEEAENEYLRRREAKKRRKKEKTGTVKKESRGRILVMERSGPGKPPADTGRHEVKDARRKLGEGIRNSVAKPSQAGQATVEGGAREEGSGGSNDSNINGDGTSVNKKQFLLEVLLIYYSIFLGHFYFTQIIVTICIFCIYLLFFMQNIIVINCKF